MADMHPPERQPVRNAEKTRTRLLEAAIATFSTASYEAVRSRDIALKAGVDVALINRYFGSKKGLFAAVLNELPRRHPPRSSEAFHQRICEDFVQRLSDEALQDSLTAVRIMAFSSSSPEVSPLLKGFMSSEIARLSGQMGKEEKTTATSLIAYVIGVHSLLLMIPDEDRAALDIEVLLRPLNAILQI